MISDSERREVAARLREVQGDVIPGTKTEVHPIAGRIIGVACGYELPDFQGLLERLADLIEPPHQCPYYDSLRHRCSFHDVPAVDRDAERTWHDFADELPPAKKPVLCKGRNGALYVGKPVTFVGGERTREVWVPRGDQYRKPEKWMEIDE